MIFFAHLVPSILESRVAWVLCMLSQLLLVHMCSCPRAQKTLLPLCYLPFLALKIHPHLGISLNLAKRDMIMFYIWLNTPEFIFRANYYKKNTLGQKKIVKCSIKEHCIFWVELTILIEVLIKLSQLPPLMVNLDCQLDRIYNYLQEKPLSMLVKDLIGF